MLEELVGRPIPDEDKGYGEEGQARLEKPAALVEDVKFRGRSIQDFLDDEDQRHGIGKLESYGDAVQSVMECEYVYSYKLAK